MNGSCEWYTPADIVDRCRAALGGRIDFDPASCAAANETVQAGAYLTAAEDALSPSTAWGGPALFVNPPYAGELVKGFARRLIVEIQAGNVERAIWLSNANTGTTAGQLVLTAARRVCFVNKRIAFVDGETGEPDANGRYDSMIAGLGDVDAGLFDTALGGLGVVLAGLGRLPAAQALLLAA